jgi:hypothetical protein
MLGRANSRMKDFYDVWLLSRTYEFRVDSLARAIAATFARRKTHIPEVLPDAPTKVFAEDPAKKNCNGLPSSTLSMQILFRLRKSSPSSRIFSCRMPGRRIKRKQAEITRE